MFNRNRERDLPDRRRGRSAPAPAAVILLVCVVLTGCDNPHEELVRVDSEKEANRILVELESRGIKQAQKGETTEQRKTVWSISVLPADLPAARTILVACDLPREKHASFAEMADSSSLIPSKGEERAKLINALSGELEKTFETYDRVVSARVHIVLPERDVLMHEPTTRPSASAMVLIKYSPGGDALPASAKEGADAPVQPEEVQQMVARSVEGLTPANVYVTYARSVARESAAPKAGAAMEAAAPVAPAANGLLPPASGGDRKLMMQLYAAVALFGLVAILMTALLVREKRRRRAAAPAA